MEQLRQWFAEHLPSVNTRIIKPRESWVDDPDMRARRSPRRATPPSSASVSEAPVAPRSWGWLWLWNEAGVPTVPVSTHVFARLAKATALAEGMPTTRNVFVPQPVVGRSPTELRAYIEGIDPIPKRPFMQGVIEGLTKPLDAEDLKGASFERSTPRLLEPDTEDNLQRAVHPEQLDGLPADHPADRGARRADAQGHEASRATRSSAGCARRRSASSGSSTSRRSRSMPSWPARGPSTCR